MHQELLHEPLNLFDWCVLQTKLFHFLLSCFCNVIVSWSKSRMSPAAESHKATNKRSTSRPKLQWSTINTCLECFGFIGCGWGKLPKAIGVQASWQYIGADNSDTGETKRTEQHKPRPIQLRGRVLQTKLKNYGLRTWKQFFLFIALHA